MRVPTPDKVTSLVNSGSVGSVVYTKTGVGLKQQEIATDYDVYNTQSSPAVVVLRLC